MTPQPLPSGSPQPDNWEAVWYPTPSTMCLSYEPDLATLAAKLSPEGWASI
jgi:hypothetical protein